MAIKLEKGGEDSLTILLVDQLSKSTVDYGMFISLNDRQSFNRHAALSDESHDKIFRYCGEAGLAGFVSSYINSILRSRYDYVSGDAKKQQIRDVDPFQDAIAISKDIVAQLKSLPQRYRLSLPLPREFSEPLLPHVTAVKLSDSVVICRSSKLPDDFPLTHNNARIDARLFSDPFDDGHNTERALQEDNLYFSSIEVGYATYSSSSQIEASFFDKIRAFYGACSALGFFSSHYIGGSEKKPFCIMHKEGEPREIIRTVEIDTDLWQRRGGRSTKLFTAVSEDPLLALRIAFDKISVIFGTEEFSRKIFTACLWFFRAKSNSNPLDSLLQSTIAMEVLLGDRENADSVGLTRLLGNRCAYLLGTTRSSRDEIIKEFIEIYNVRSSIVHTGKHRLGHKDRTVSNNCINLCGRVIAKELELHHSTTLDSAV